MVHGRKSIKTYNIFSETSDNLKENLEKYIPVYTALRHTLNYSN